MISGMGTRLRDFAIRTAFSCHSTSSENADRKPSLLLFLHALQARECV
jgi:hypothetical protein